MINLFNDLTNVRTVNELLEFCKHEIASGNGDKKIFIATDEEGNEFHPMYYGITSSADDIKAYHKMGCINGNPNPDEIVLLG